MRIPSHSKIITMFGQVIYNKDYVRSVHKVKSDISPGTIKYHNIDDEESYLRSLYTDPSFDLNGYIESLDASGDGYVVKLAPFSNEIDYSALVHEAYMTIKLAGNGVKLQTIREIKFTNDYLYVIYEYIHGEQLRAFIVRSFVQNEEMNLSSFVSVLANIMNMLEALYIQHQFTHYDLHPDNILLLDEEPTIIDLEFAYANINGSEHGVTLLSDNNDSLILPKYYWPFDIYKLLCGLKYTVVKIYDITEDELKRYRVRYAEEIEKAKTEGNKQYQIDLESSVDGIEVEYAYRLANVRKRSPNNSFEKLIDILLNYFISEIDFQEVMEHSILFPAPRIDIMDKYKIYETNFLHFYQYFNNVISSIDKLTSCN